MYYLTLHSLIIKQRSIESVIITDKHIPNLCFPSLTALEYTLAIKHHPNKSFDSTENRSL